MNDLTIQEIDEMNETCPAFSRETQIKRGKYPVRGLGDLLHELVVNLNEAGSTDEKVKVDSVDTLQGFLQDKLKAGTNITLSVVNDVGVRKVNIASAGGGGGSFIGSKMFATPIIFTSAGGDNVANEIAIPVLQRKANILVNAGLLLATTPGALGNVVIGIDAYDGFTWSSLAQMIPVPNSSSTTSARESASLMFVANLTGIEKLRFNVHAGSSWGGGSFYNLCLSIMESTEL